MGISGLWALGLLKANPWAALSGQFCDLKAKFILGKQNGLLGLNQCCLGGWAGNLLSSAQLLLQHHFPFPLSSLWFSGSP